MYGPSTSSGDLSISTQVYARPGLFYAAILKPPSTGVATLTVYDSPSSSTSGRTIIAYIEQYAGTSTEPLVLPIPVVVNFGLYCAFSGTGSSFQIHFSPG